MPILSLRLPASLHRAARELAKEEGVSINQLVTTALAEKVAVLRTVDYLRERAARGDGGDWERILAAVPDVELKEYDPP